MNKLVRSLGTLGFLGVLSYAGYRFFLNDIARDSLKKACKSVYNTGKDLHDLVAQQQGVVVEIDVIQHQEDIRRSWDEFIEERELR